MELQDRDFFCVPKDMGSSAIGVAMASVGKCK